METIKKLGLQVKSLEVKLNAIQTENDQLKAALSVKSLHKDQSALMKSQQDVHEKQTAELKAEVTKLKFENAGFRNGATRLIENVNKHSKDAEDYKKRLVAFELKNREDEIKNQNREDRFYENYQLNRDIFSRKAKEMQDLVKREITSVVECYSGLHTAVNNSRLIRTELASLIKKYPLFFMEVINENPKVLVNRFEEFFRPLWSGYQYISSSRMSELEDLILLQDKQKKEMRDSETRLLLVVLERNKDRENQRKEIEQLEREMEKLLKAQKIERAELERAVTGNNELTLEKNNHEKEILQLQQKLIEISKKHEEEISSQKDELFAQLEKN